MPVVPVDDVEDGRLADYRTVSDPGLLRERGVFVAESRFVVRELLAHPRFETRSLLVTEAALASLGDLLEARDGDLPVYVQSPGQGLIIIGALEPPGRAADWSLDSTRGSR